MMISSGGKTLSALSLRKTVSNTVADIDSGTFAWSVRSGHARVNLETGAAAFEVAGLAINGTQFSGTPGPITRVMGTLVCGYRRSLDFPALRLEARGQRGLVPS